MKKFYLAFLFLFIGATAQAITFGTKEPSKTSLKPAEDSGNGCFDENTRLLNVGVGIGGGYYYRGAVNSTYSASPAFSLSYEQALKTKLGPGYVGLGGYVGYRHTRYHYNYGYNNYFYKGVYYTNTGNYYYEHNWNHIYVAFRGAYHLDMLNWEKGEVYGGLLLGVRFQTYSYTTNDTNPYRYNNQLYQNNAYVTGSIFAGARWFPAPKIALFAELGYGISYLTVGASFKI